MELVVVVVATFDDAATATAADEATSFVLPFWYDLVDCITDVWFGAEHVVGIVVVVVVDDGGGVAFVVIVLLDDEGQYYLKRVHIPHRCIMCQA